MTYLITVAPVFDEVTEITVQEKERVKLYAEEYDVQVFDYSEGLATPVLVDEILREYPSAMFFHADHGSPDKLYGVNASVIINLDNVDLLASRECYMDNCSSAKTLGVEAFKQGCPMFWGYKDVFSLTTDALDEFSDFVLYGVMRRIEQWDDPTFDWQQTPYNGKSLTMSSEYWRSYPGILKRIELLSTDFTYRMVNDTLVAYGHRNDVEEFEWVGSLDERTCSYCDSYIGARFGLHQALPSLPAHAGCRCEWRLVRRET